MFIHSVYFWLQKGLAPQDMQRFQAGIHSLAKIQAIKQCFIATPAATDRPVIDRSYDYALVVIFADQDAHDAYQVDPIHDRFRNDCARYWDKVVIYDSIT